MIEVLETPSALLSSRLEAYPPERILHTPTPGTATEEDLLAERETLAELIDGTLVEKAMGARASFLQYRLMLWLGNFVEANNLGILLGADMIVRVGPNQLRLPDLSYYSIKLWDRPWMELPNIMPVMPELAIEVLSDGNTKSEMQEKRNEYFAAGVNLVWIVDPIRFAVQVYPSPMDQTLLSRTDTLDGGAVLPGFTLPLAKLFDDPREQVQGEKS